MINNAANQVVWITGASSGIGAALVQEYASRGWKVAMLARRTDRLEKLKADLQLGDQGLILRGDVTQEQDLVQAVQTIMRTWNRIDTVIANAGFGVSGKVEDLSIDDFQKQFETNFFGVLKTLYASLNELKKTQGSFVLLGSVASYISLSGSAAYSSSKFAVRGLADALFYELREDGISTTLISPGFVDSEIRRVDNQGQLHPNVKDPVPAWLRMPSEKAARQIFRASLHRKREKIITGHGQLLVFLQRHFPTLLQALLLWSRTRARPEPKGEI